jgi:hypothetical protein
MPLPGQPLRCTRNRLGKCSGHMQRDPAARGGVILSTTAAGDGRSRATGRVVRIRSATSSRIGCVGSAKCRRLP